MSESKAGVGAEHREGVDLDPSEGLGVHAALGPAHCGDESPGSADRKEEWDQFP